MFTNMDGFEDELAMLRNETPQWDACLRAMERHPQWDPEDIEASLAIINQIIEEWRVS